MLHPMSRKTYIEENLIFEHSQLRRVLLQHAGEAQSGGVAGDASLGRAARACAIAYEHVKGSGL